MPISRLFNDHAMANTAVARLRSAGYSLPTIRVVTAESGQNTEHGLQRLGVAKANAARYVARIAAGATLLVVEAPFGTAAHATQILEGTAPGDMADSATAYEAMAWDDAAPLSSAFGWPVLAHDPAPLSRLFGLATLTRAQTGKARLSHQAAPLSSMLGLGVLSSNAAPLSRMLGLGLLSHGPAPLSKAIGMRTLTHHGAPMMGALSDDPAPLSNLVGLPTISHDDT